MKLTGLKRTMLAGLVTLSVVGAPLATFTAGPASANQVGGSLQEGSSCYRGVSSGTACSLN
jgi:hypothetical protein